GTSLRSGRHTPCWRPGFGRDSSSWNRLLVFRRTLLSEFRRAEARTSVGHHGVPFSSPGGPKRRSRETKKPAPASAVAGSWFVESGCYGLLISRRAPLPRRRMDGVDNSSRRASRSSRDDSRPPRRGGVVKISRENPRDSGKT